jgi:hypothetical protein
MKTSAAYEDKNEQKKIISENTRREHGCAEPERVGRQVRDVKEARIEALVSENCVQALCRRLRACFRCT